MTIKDLWLKTTFTGMWNIFEEGSKKETIIKADETIGVMTDRDNPNHYLSEKEVKYFDVLPHPYYDNELVMRVCYEKGE